MTGPIEKRRPVAGVASLDGRFGLLLSVTYLQSSSGDVIDPPSFSLMALVYI